ncbi:MAG: hypothetical protein ACOY90_23220 [Candidatus Zhuqueibacterota bacterium]
MKKKFINGLLLALLSLSFVFSDSQHDNLNCEFIQDGNRYSFRGSFIVRATCDCLIDVIYNFEHLSEYAIGASSIEWVRSGDNSYEVTYTYRIFVIFENKSTWRRTLNSEEQKVIFEMISSENNISLMPQLLSSSGYYQIKRGQDGYQVEYFQECTVKPGLLKNSYIATARKKANEFLREFKKYIEETCVESS